MKQMIHEALTTNPDLALIVDGRIYGQTALGHGHIPPQPEKPFIIYTIGVSSSYREVRHTSRAAETSLQVYCYQHLGSYTTINQMLPLVRETIIGLEGQASPSGTYRCHEAVWTGYSQESRDDDLVASMRFATFDLTGTDA